MIKHILTIILAALLPIAASAVTAKDALDKTSQKVNSAGAVTAKFTATGDGATISGTLTMAKQKFCMLGDDFGVWYNGTDLWSYSVQAGETSLSCPLADELMEINPFYIIRNYSNIYTASKVSEGKGKYVVKLQSVKKGAMVSTAIVTIDTSTWLPARIDVTFANGNTLAIAISDAVISDKAPGASTFEYPANKYPAIEVIDLR